MIIIKFSSLLLQSSVSHDPSEFAVQKTFLLISMFKTVEYIFFRILPFNTIQKLGTSIIIILFILGGGGYIEINI